MTARTRLLAVSGPAVQQLNLPTEEAAIVQRSPNQAQEIANEWLQHSHGKASPVETNDQLTLSQMLANLEALADQLEASVRR